MKRIGNSDVTVIIPALNEEKSIGEVIWKLNQMDYHSILVVDGNSSDRTVEIAKELGVDIILQNGRGKGDALRQVFNHDSLNGDAIVMMDADGSMDPKEIPLLVETLNDGSDLAKGSRFLFGGHSEDMNQIRRFGNLFFVFLVNLFWSANYTDLCYGFGAFRRDALRNLYPHLKSKNFEIEAEIFVKAKKLGLKVAEVPSIELRRSYGKSNLKSFRDGYYILRTIIREFIGQYRLRNSRIEE